MRFFSLILAVVFFAGCSLLNVFDGNIPQNNWKMQKIIVGGKEYLSPQSLKAETLRDSQNEPPKDSDEPDDEPDDASSEENTLLAHSNTDLPDGADDASGKVDDTKKDKVLPTEGEFTSLNEVSTMTFDPYQHRIYGLAACNNYFASYAWKDDDHIEIANSGITRKLCSPDELMSFEFKFMRDFNGLFTITKNKTSMILDNGKMQIYLQAVKSQ